MTFFDKHKVDRVLAKNTAMQYVLYIAQMLFPLITQPYMTRVLSVQTYGIYTYSVNVMTYISLIVSYGFILSSTKDVVQAGGDREEIGRIMGRVLWAKLMLSVAALLVLLVIIAEIELLRGYALFLFLYYISTVITALLPDFLFRGIERMEILTYRFVICKAVTTALTFVLIKGDGDYLMLPLLNLLSSVLALILSRVWELKMGFHIKMVRIREGFLELRRGFIYFFSNSASTAFNSLNTFLIGIYFSAQDIAFWGAAMLLIGAAQGMYGPISNSLYPYMIRERKLGIIKKTLLIFVPLVGLATLGCWLLGDWIFTLFYGDKYLDAVWIFKLLLPVLFLSFPSVMLGWPALGAISKPKEITATAVLAALIQVLMLAGLIAAGHFTIANVAIVRILAELVLVLSRWWLCIKYKGEFADGKA